MATGKTSSDIENNDVFKPIYVLGDGEDKTKVSSGDTIMLPVSLESFEGPVTCREADDLDCTKDNIGERPTPSDSGEIVKPKESQDQEGLAVIEKKDCCQTKLQNVKAKSKKERKTELREMMKTKKWEERLVERRKRAQAAKSAHEVGTILETEEVKAKEVNILINETKSIQDATITEEKMLKYVGADENKIEASSNDNIEVNVSKMKKEYSKQREKEKEKEVLIQRCQWEGCRRPYLGVDALDHIYRKHVGAGRRSYSCGWEGCPRKHIPFHKRPAIIRHIKTHLNTASITKGKGQDVQSNDTRPIVDVNAGVTKKSRNSKANLELHMEQSGSCSRHNLQCYDVVWANIHGYGWWPSRLENPFEYAHMVKQGNVPIGSLLIYLYGVNRLQWVQDNQILGFKDFWEDFHGECQLKVFMSALEEAQRDCNYHPIESTNPATGLSVKRARRSSNNSKKSSAGLLQALASSHQSTFQPHPVARTV